MRLELSGDADVDLVEMLAFGIERFGLSVARAYFLSFDKSFALLRHYPNAGEPIDDILPGARKLTHDSHRIFYRVRGDTVRILRILHHARDTRSGLRV